VCRRRPSESLGPTAIDGADAVDQYLVALDDASLVETRVLAALEHDFVVHAKRFADRRGVSYEAWRDVGVPEHVLARAGIHEVAVV
jgi:hypothetical protein